MLASPIGRPDGSVGCVQHSTLQEDHTGKKKNVVAFHHRTSGDVSFSNMSTSLHIPSCTCPLVETKCPKSTAGHVLHMFDSAWYDGLLHQRPMIGTHERSGQHSDHLVLLVVLGHDRLGQHLHLLGNLRQCALHRIQLVSLLGHLIVHAP